MPISLILADVVHKFIAHHTFIHNQRQFNQFYTLLMDGNPKPVRGAININMPELQSQADFQLCQLLFRHGLLLKTLAKPGEEHQREFSDLAKNMFHKKLLKYP